MVSLSQWLEWVREALNKNTNKPQEPDQPNEEEEKTGGEHTGSSSNPKESEETTEESEDSTDNSDDSGFSMPEIPHVGSKWSHSEPWPERPENPKNTIEVRLYWHENEPKAEQYCYQVKKYVEYALLDAWADDGYDVDVQIHHTAVPASVENPDDFMSWQYDLDERAKDSNMIIHDLGGKMGMAGSYGGYIDDKFFDGWERDPDDPIKPVGGGGASEGIGVVIHEIGHTLGFSHRGERLEMYSKSWVSPMSTGYGNSGANNFAFRYCEDIRNSEPRVE